MFNSLILADEDDNTESNNLFVFFKLDEKVYAVSTSHTIEVLKLPMLERPQKMSSYVLGYLNYNNLTINVLNIRSILDLENKPYSLNNELIILKTEETMFGIVVDNVLDILTIPPNDIQLSPSGATDSFVKMFYLHEDSMVSILDLYVIEEFIKSNRFKESETNSLRLLPEDERSKMVLMERSKSIIQKSTSNIIHGIYNQDQFLIFDLNQNNYCVNIQNIKELVAVKNTQITKLPFTPAYIQGIINLRGDFYTIVNLKSFLNLENEEMPGSQIIVLNAKDNNIAILADEIQGISNVDTDRFIHKASIKHDSKYIMAEFIEDDRIFNVLNIDKFLNDEKLFINIES